MNCYETVTVNAKAVNWLKEKYPELCIKAGLCERVAGRLYTKTLTTPPAAPVQEPVACRHEWFRTGAMEPGVCRCIKCGVWNTHAAAKRTWIGLTDEEQQKLYDEWIQAGDGWGTFYALIEAKLKEKNNG